MKRRISIFGSTGSIGVNTVDLITRQGGADAYDVVALTGASNIALLAEQAVALQADVAVTARADKRDALEAALAGTGIEAAAGPEALIAAAARPADWIMSAIVGAAGLAPTLEAARQGSVLALANKESLVCAGDLLLREVAAAGTRLLPVDSEHSAVFQCLRGESRAALDRVILTASGGPFRDWTRDQMARATLAEAVAHPNWDMGQRISIDSASMFNKALEVIEAKYLFDIQPDQIEVLVHPQSIVHSLVGFTDGSVIAQLGPPDMRGAIGYALNYPERRALPVERLDLAKLACLDFRHGDAERFPALRLARKALEMGGLSGAILNAAKEAAMDAFIAGRIGFLDMADHVESALDALSAAADPTYSLEHVIAVDARARAHVTARVTQGEDLSHA
ncbi:1-deoxy-D-xylulose-5-phosphate reductoisomerase [Rubricella aquisinus]|uniref:1-deoxy-D-xylulose 5-phosphate reductoisomerase n=1 Tax=Rubricella aquisinus TaxID=2028108 RepID=A0A840WYG7_9RHOB|nr:1-deoxy-D-xylulose-5-phosphate reductoisomerase [Rubricella aquisinus]